MSVLALAAVWLGWEPCGVQTGACSYPVTLEGAGRRLAGCSNVEDYIRSEQGAGLLRQGDRAGEGSFGGLRTAQ